jgi:hypothetical protein
MALRLARRHEVVSFSPEHARRLDFVGLTRRQYVGYEIARAAALDGIGGCKHQSSFHWSSQRRSDRGGVRFLCIVFKDVNRRFILLGIAMDIEFLSKLQSADWAANGFSFFACNRFSNDRKQPGNQPIRVCPSRYECIDRRLFQQFCCMFLQFIRLPCWSIDST